MDGMIPGMHGIPPGMHPIPGLMEEQHFDPEAYHHHQHHLHQQHQQQQHLLHQQQQQQHHFQEYEEPPRELREPEYDNEDEGAPGDNQIRFPVALEKALDLKSERAKEIGLDREELDNVHDEPEPEKEKGPLDIYSDGEDEDDDEEVEDEVDSKKVKSKTQEKKEDKKRKRKRKKKKKRQGKQQNKENEVNGEIKPEEKEKEKDPEVEVEYVQETVNMNSLHPQYRQFAKILEHFKIPESEMKTQPIVDISREMKLAQELGAKSKELTEFKKVPKLPDEFDDEEGKQDGDKKEKLSKRKLKKLTRLSVAELKQLVSRPDVVEMHDVTARDPKLLVQLKAHRNTVPVPRHWCFKRKYLQGKRGIEKPPFELPHFIKKTGIMEMRSALTEKDEQKALKARMREKARPKLGKIDIDYQKLHDAFFKWQTKPKLTIHGDLYYEGKEYETRLREKKPGDLSDDLRTALGMPVGPHAQKVPPPWLIAMQRYGPPPSYPSLKIPGLNAPIPESCSFGYHAGGWGKPPVDETGKPLYGDVFGIQTSIPKILEMEYEIDKSIWGELESESEEESEEEEEEEGEGGEEPDETGMVTPAEGLVTPSGMASIPAGIHTPDIIELRKRKIESEMEGGDTPALYQVLPEKKVEKVSGMMGSTHIYDVPSVPGGPIGTKRPEGPGTVELALDPSELDLVDTEAMAARYEEQIKEQQSQLQKEDLSDVVAEHISRQKAKRKKPQTTQEKSTKKYKEFKF